MDQESGEIWIAETLLQPILPKSDRLLTPSLEKQAAIDIADADHSHQFAVFRDGNSPEILHTHVGSGL